MGELQEKEDRADREYMLQHHYTQPTLVGRGAFARVYRVWDARRAGFVACKVSGEQKLLRREADYMRQLEHPLFPVSYEYIEEKGVSILVMEHIWGDTLERILARRGKLAPERSKEIAICLAEGLRYLHEGKPSLIFRDMKPANIIIRQDGAVKLIDLGCVGERGSTAIAGSRGYAAPEQLLGNKPTGYYSDVYGLGRVLQRMLGDAKMGRLREVAEQCVRPEIGDRIPDMRYLLRELTNDKGYGDRKKSAFSRYYVYEKNVCIF